MTDLLTRPDTHEPHEAPRRRRTLLVVLTVLLVVAGGIGWRAWSAHAADIRSGTTLVDLDGLAASYGIDVDLLAVTAAGGLIELRYQVVDPDKADRLSHDPDLAPAFIVEATGETLVMKAAPHHHGAELRLGGTYFILLPNAHNAIHEGTEVTLVIGDRRVEHLVVAG